MHDARTARPYGEYTAILFYQSLTGGALYTHDVCRREHKPYIVLDATRISESGAAGAIMRFIREHEIQVLNVAGPRLSKWAEGYEFALKVVGEVIVRVKGEKNSG